MLLIGNFKMTIYQFILSQFYLHRTLSFVDVWFGLEDLPESSDGGLPIKYVFYHFYYY